MKKRFLLLFSAVISLSGYAAVGDTFTVDKVTYSVTGDQTVAVSEVDRTLTSVNINSEVDNPADNKKYTVTAVGDQAFYYSRAVSVKLPNTVTSIGYQAFSSADVTSIELGTGVKTIGDYAFSGSKLASIALPEGLESIGGSAFFTCKFTSIDFPSSLKDVGPSAFYKVPLTSVSLPSGVTFGDKAFLNCDKLESVTVADGIKAISNGMFQNCKALATIDLPSSIEKIGSDAFLETSIKAITIPAATTEIGFSAFAIPTLETITVADGNSAFITVDGVLYSKDKTLLYAYPAKSANTEVVLPAECLGICEAAFWKSNVSKVTLNDKLRAIDEYAFCFSSNLKEIKFPASVVLIGTEAFASTGLTSVELPSAMPQLQQAVFAGCTSLKSVTIPASVNYIDIRTFWGCTSLQTVNCYAMTPPMLEAVYEDYERQFYNVPSSCKLHVPAGAVDAYKSDASWRSEFSQTNIIGDLASAFAPVSFSPADGSAVTLFDGIDITFSDDATIVTSTPDVKVICGSLVAGVPVGDKVSVDGWRIVKGSDSKTLRLYPEDYDGYTAPFNMEKGKEYYLTIPAGTFKNAAGDTNDAITVYYEGAWEKPTVKLVSVDPAEDTKLEQIDRLTFTFEESVTVVSSKLGSIKTVIGELVDGVPTGSAGPEDDWYAVAGQSTGTQVAIFPCDYDAFVVPVPVKEGKVTFIQLPEGLFRLTSSYSTVSDAFTLAYSSDSSGVSDIEAALDAPVEIYTVDGVRVNEMTPGKIYIVRTGSKVSKTLAR